MAGALAFHHSAGLGDELVTQGGGRPRVQVLGHDRELAEVAPGQHVFVLDAEDERGLVRLNTQRGGGV